MLLFAISIILVSLCSCQKGARNQQGFDVVCDAIEADRYMTQVWRLKAGFTNDEQLTMKTMDRSSKEVNLYIWDLRKGAIDPLPKLDLKVPLPCEDSCDFTVYDQSPDQEWQLVRTIIAAEPVNNVEYWLLNKNASIQLPYIASDMHTWNWSLDSMLFWTEQTLSGPANNALLVNLEDETITAFGNADERPSGIPEDTASPFPIAGLVNVTLSPSQNELWYTDWTQEMNHTINRYDPLTHRFDTVDIENVYQMVWNSGLEQMHFVRKYPDELIIQSMDGAHSVNVPLEFLQNTIGSRYHIFDLMYSDFQISPNGQHLYIQPLLFDSNRIIMLSCRSNE